MSEEAYANYALLDRESADVSIVCFDFDCCSRSVGCFDEGEVLAISFQCYGFVYDYVFVVGSGFN